MSEETTNVPLISSYSKLSKLQRLTLIYLSTTRDGVCRRTLLTKIIAKLWQEEKPEAHIKFFQFIDSAFSVTFCKSLDALEKRGLITRHPKITGRYGSHNVDGIGITDEGKRIAKELKDERH